MARLICWWKGHKRGNRLRFVTTTSTADVGRVRFECSSCEMTTTQLTHYLEQNNLRTAWRLFHPLDRYLLIPFCEREWGEHWRDHVDTDLQAVSHVETTQY